MFNRGFPFSKLKILVSHILAFRRRRTLKRTQYARITLTPLTTFYFFLAVFTCLALSALQIFTFTINSNAASVLNPIDSRIPNFGVPILHKGRLELCPSLPDQGTKTCVQVIDFHTNYVNHTLVC